MGVIMFIVVGVSLDTRYQTTSFPLMLPIMAYALQAGIKKISSKMFYGSYMILSIGLIVLYNYR
jgi:hypothetical protein